MKRHILLIRCIFLFFSFSCHLDCFAENSDSTTAQVETFFSKPISRFAIEYRDSDGEKNFVPLANNGILFSGGLFKVTFTVLENCYLYIFQVDSAQNISRLFPMKELGGITLNNTNPIPADCNYILPGKNQSFKLDKTVGLETIYCIASEKRVEIFEAEESQFQSPDKRQKEIDTLFDKFQQISNEDEFSFDFGDFLVELSDGKLACKFQFEHR